MSYSVRGNYLKDPLYTCHGRRFIFLVLLLSAPNAEYLGPVDVVPHAQEGGREVSAAFSRQGAPVQIRLFSLQTLDGHHLACNMHRYTVQYFIPSPTHFLLNRNGKHIRLEYSIVAPTLYYIALVISITYMPCC